MSGTVLIVEDDAGAAAALSALLVREGYEVLVANSAEEGESMFEPEVDLVLTDLRLPGLSGLELYRKLHHRDPDVAVVVMTAYGSVKGAVEAMREGVVDYLTKPLDADELLVVVDKAIAGRRQIEEIARLREAVGERYSFESIVGDSGAMQDVLRKVAKVARSSATVLVRGESGTGKELIARAIHMNSPRRDGPFVAVNCASLPETLLESELFGYEKGAFTGATKRKKGKFELATGGTLFLDEVGDMPMSIQAKLLRAIQERKIDPLGSTAQVDVDVRIVTSTNVDLEARLTEGRMREDLYFRLNVIPIFLPSLRDRKEDIPAMVARFVSNAAGNAGRQTPSVSPEVMRTLVSYDWPGNVRELESACEQMVVLADGDVIDSDVIPPPVLGAASGGTVASISDVVSPLSDQMEQAEKRVIQRALYATGGNRTRAAKLLGISIRSMRYKVKRYRL
jgi:two-component system response regulator AtoC